MVHSGLSDIKIFNMFQFFLALLLLKGQKARVFEVHIFVKLGETLTHSCDLDTGNQDQ